MGRYIIILFVPIIFFFTTKAKAHQSNYKFSHITINEGLSQSSVNCIYQDNFGFLWFGTFNGLNRYDGHSFKIFKGNSQDTLSLKSSYINTIFQDSHNQLWIGTDGGGLSLFDFNDETFHNVENKAIGPKTIYAIEQINDSVIVVGANEGLFFFNLFTKKYSVNSISENLSGIRIYALELIDENNLIIGTRWKGLISCNLKSKTFENILLPTKYKNEESVYSIQAEDKTKLWIGTNNGLVLVDLNSKKTKLYINSPKNDHSIVGNKIRSIEIDENKNLWVATRESGLSVANLNNFSGDFENYINSTCNANSIGSNQLFCIFKDRSNVIWIGTKGNGISKYQPVKFNYIRNKTSIENESSNSSVWEIFKGSNNRTWVAYEYDLFYYAEDNFDDYQIFTKNNSELHENGIEAICEDQNGTIWLGSYNGMQSFNTSTNKFEIYLNEKNSNLSNNEIRCLTVDSRNNIWIGTANGVSIMSYSNNSFSFINLLHSTTDLNTISNNRINTIVEDKSGNIWIGTSGGGFNKIMADYNIKKKQFKIKSYQANKIKGECLNNPYVMTIYPDEFNNLWIGTFEGGINKFNIEQETFEYYTEDDGLPNNVIYGILPENKNVIWASTNNGLVKFNIEKSTFKHFEQSDGLQSNEFNRGAFFKSNDGAIYFGGINGLNYFNENSLKMNEMKPLVHVIDFKIYNQSIHKKDFRNVKSPLWIKNNVAVYPNEKVFSIDFVGLSFISQQKNTYAYKLEGFSEKWIYTNENNRTATYTNLDGGDYIFQVKAANNDGYWSDEVAELHIKVIPPFYKNIWFKSLVLFVIIFILYFGYRIRIINLRKQKIDLKRLVHEQTSDLQEMNVLLEEKQSELITQNEQIVYQNKELEEHQNNLEKKVIERTKELSIALKNAENADMLKTAFLANMSHEIRTPMNAILGFIDLINHPDIPSSEKIEFQKLVEHSGHTLLRLIDDIIDTSKIESGNLKINIEEFDLSKELVQIKQVAGEIIKRNNKNIELLFSVQEGPFYIKSDRIRVNQILTNFINNAIKFTEEGSITVGVTQISNGFLKGFVKDTGIGISPEAQEYIFDRFRKIEDDSSKVFRGAGLGLAITKDLVQLLGGRIWVESELCKGSTFCFTIKIN